MTNNKLLALLATFNTKDWQQFGLYIRSPFFNQTTSLVLLADELESSIGKLGIEKLELNKEQVYRQVFPDRSYSDADFNRLCSRLLSLASSYLAYQSWKTDGIMPDYHKLQAFLDRKLNKHFRFAYQKASSSLAKEASRSIHYHQHAYLLAEMGEWQISRDKTQLFGPQMQIAADGFDEYFIAQKLQHLCNIVSLNKIQPNTYQIHFAKQIIEIAEHLEHIPIVAIYRNLYLLLTAPNPDLYFLQLKSYAVLHENILAQRELNFIYLILTNHCIRRLREGEKEYAPILLDLYELALAKGFLMDNNTITSWTFKNIVKLGLGLQRFQWVENFIKHYAPMLAENERTEALHFNLADLYYHQQAYEKAQLHLKEVEFSDVRYYLHGRILLAKIYYTIQAWEALDSLLSAFKIYLLRSKKMNRDEKKPYLNFIRILNKILRNLPEQHSKTRETIAKTSMLTARTWLLEICGDVVMW